MTRQVTDRIAWALVLTAALTTAAQSQDVGGRFFRDVMLGSGLHFQRWSGDGDLSVQELSIPVTAIVPVTRRLSLDLVSGSGFASLDRGGSSSLNGLTDTKVRASLILGEELALVTLGVSTPTGKTELSDDEREISRFLSQNALRFRTPSFGQGLDVNVGLAVARKVGETVVGLGAGYLMKGEFTPADGGEAYQPGTELSLTAGLDRELAGGDGKLTVDAVYTLYGEDERAGAAAFQSGNKLLVQLVGWRRASSLDWRLFGLARMKADSRSYRSSGDVDLANGAQYEAGVSVLTRRRGKLNLRALAQVRMHGAGDTFGSGGALVEAGEATVLSAGPGIRLRLGGQSYLDLNVQVATGDIDGDSVTGIDVSGGLWIRL